MATEVEESFELAWTISDPVLGMMSKEVQLTDTETALVGVDDHAVGNEAFENRP